MASLTSLPGPFVSSDEELLGTDPVALGSESGDDSPVQWPDTSGSSLFEFCATLAADAVPSSLGAEGGGQGVDDGGSYGDDGDLSDLQAFQPDANQRRRGGAAGMGGRPARTGARTRENFPRGCLRVLAEALYLRGLSIIFDDPLLDDVSLADREAVTALVSTWRAVDGKEEIWAVPYMFGVVARFSVWGKTDHGKRSCCCTWISSDAVVRCTCLGSDIYNADVSVNRVSTCEHTIVFAEAVELLAEALKRDPSIVRQWLFSCMAARTRDAPDAVVLVDEEAPVWRLHKDIVVVVSVHRGVAVPVPVHLPKKGVSCGFCPLAGVRGCSHTKLAEQYRVAHGNVPLQLTATGCVRSTVSTKSLSLFNCLRAIAFDRRVGELAQLGGVYELKAPTRCSHCGTDLTGVAADHDSALPAIIHTTLGPCSMRVTRRRRPNCEQLSARDGREDSVVLLSLISGSTVAWARKCAEFVRSGTHISDVLSQCLSDWAGLKSAGLLPSSAKSRGVDTLRAIILAFMRLSVVDPDRSLYDCSACKLPCGRYLVVTSDCICLGYDANSQPFSFEHVCEAVPAVNMQSREGCLVVGEQARRMMRHALVPDDPVAVTDRTLRSAEMALSCLFPVGVDGNEAEDVPSATRSIRKLLGMVWRVDAAALPLAESLLLAYKTTQVKPAKERKRRADCAVRLAKSIAHWRAGNPDAVALYDACRTEVEKDRAAAVVENEARKGAGGQATDGVGNGRARPPTSRGRRRRAQQSGGGTVKPGDEPALNIPKPLLQPHMQRLDANDVDHICRMVLAFTLDPVIAGVKVRHFDALEDVSRVLRSSSPRVGIDLIVAEATCRTREKAAKSSAAVCLLELRHVMVALQAATLVFDSVPAFATAIADVLEDAVTCARTFYSDFAADVKARHEYMERYLKGGETDEELISLFRERYPKASSSTSVTGVYTPGRQQCRAEPFEKGDKTPCGTCEKGFNSSDKYSDGALTLCCACAHPKILGIVVLDRKESPQVLINAVLSRFPRLPRYLVYDFACGVVRCAMAKLPWMLRDLSVVSDRFHVCNHTCSHFYNANSYGDLDFKNTLTHEQRNASIRKMEQILRGAGRYGYLAVLCYQTSVLNSFAESRSAYQKSALEAAAAVETARAAQPRGFDFNKTSTTKPRVTLPIHFDMRADYFRRHPCRCCGYTAPPLEQHTSA